MIRKFILPLLAVVGVAMAIFTVMAGQRPVPAAQPVSPPAQASFTAYVAGAGIIEASSENIAIGTPVGDVVTEICARVGDRVTKGQPLFKLRDRVAAAELVSRKATLEAARAKLARLRSLPRPEDLPPAQARVEEATAFLEDSRTQLALWDSVTDRRAVSQDEVTRRRFAVRVAEARLATARAELDLLKAGSWKPDIAISEADVAAAEASVQQAEVDLDRRTVRAPVDGQVLQVKIRPGEYAMTGPLNTPLMILGSVDDLFVRVDVDENEAWRVRPNSPAEAYVRGNSQLKTPLKFVRIEPFIVPKRSLTGDSTERVDTRVLQVLYTFRRDAFPVYVGQQMDVFIEAAPLAPTTQPSTNRAAAR